MDVLPLNQKYLFDKTWWHHQMETFFRVTGPLCGEFTGPRWTGNSPVPGEFPAQRPVTRSFGVFFDLHLNKRLRKQSWGWWFEMLSRPLWRHCSDFPQWLQQLVMKISSKWWHFPFSSVCSSNESFTFTSVSLIWMINVCNHWYLSKKWIISNNSAWSLMLHSISSICFHYKITFASCVI